MRGSTMRESVTDVRIILECLQEAYQMEGDMVRSGKNIHATMIYPFVRQAGFRSPYRLRAAVVGAAVYPFQETGSPVTTPSALPVSLPLSVSACPYLRVPWPA